MTQDENPSDRPGVDELLTAERLAAKSPGAIAEFEPVDTSFLGRAQRFFHGQPIAAPAIVLMLALLVFGYIAGDKFIDPFNFSLIVQQVMIVGTLGIAQTIIILTAGIDLSVGAIMVLSSVVMGRLALISGLPPVLALLIGLVIGGLCGGLNGILVTRFRLPPFIATLGTLNVIFALNLWYSKSETLRSQDIDATAPILKWTGNTFDLFDTRITYGSILMVVLYIVFAYVLKQTAWGKHVYAVGDDPEAARLAGIRTNRVLLSVYVVAGLMCAVAGWVLIGRIGSVSPQAGQTANLDSITAVVIGGTSLFGGRGLIYGTLLGALIVGIFRNGLALSGVDVLWQNFTVGLLILVAVAVDQRIRKAVA